MVESGKFYSKIVDPVLKPMRKKMLKHVEKNDAVIDIACGTGAQVFELAKLCNKVVGVDLSDSMILFAQKKQEALNIKNVEFKITDATRLSEFSDKSFDIATTTLALHQFKPELFPAIISEMKRISKKIIIIDYHIPLPKNLYGYGCKIAEFFAGVEHNSNFKKFARLGGLPKIMQTLGVEITQSEIFGNGAFQIIVGKEIGLK